jgi:hypothetical protein
MNLGNYGLEVGCPNLAVLDQQSVAEVLRFTRRPLPSLAMSRWLMPRRCVSSPSPDLADFWPENPPFC